MSIFGGSLARRDETAPRASVCRCARHQANLSGRFARRRANDQVHIVPKARQRSDQPVERQSCQLAIHDV